ncbi:nuclear transport factor 2 family protein [Microbulbifer sp. JMSA004]|uniref:nuclear transport factor 2 family protein n=1 Tax=unclassified Microbulbifer TaxID=2619833 RepID=UPI0024AD4F6F|nr:nuclear transport factor 2 family protein [Microbulbifer sp. VAAF005]WHI47510.1 nuclear transport factor 2 family protein [Microbulbifer sp. VAAF005]
MNNSNKKIAESIALWHEMVAARDLSRLPAIVAEDAVFRSPAFFKPYHSSAAVCLILNTVMQVFESFEYDREFTTESGHDLALEFAASIGDKSLKGLDIIRFNDEGKIIEFEVMIRPLNALQKLAEEMSGRLSQYVTQYKDTQQA